MTDAMLTAESAGTPADELLGSPQASARLRPIRAGIINLWDYVDEEFDFADGRLALRGHNGSGKTKALEVLFPFILDGSLDARRLDPFSGENRTMKSNLLYRGQESEYGYVWLEFGGLPGETVTLVVGLRVHKSWDRPRPAFFITGQRIGADFGLLSADSRPLTTKHLVSLLGQDAYLGDKRGAYTEAVDARLFGLGRERYAQLIDLLLALRRPLLAKDLDPVKVSQTLTAGLSPVDEGLVDQAARDFENLAAVQKQYDDLTAANTAVRDFLAHYTAYLRALARDQLDQVSSRLAAVTDRAEQITAAASEVAKAEVAERAAADAGAQTAAELRKLRAQVQALHKLDSYKEHAELALRREHADKDVAELARERERLEKANEEVAGLRSEAATVAARLADMQADGDRELRRLAGAAEAAGLTRDGEPADTGTDLAVTAKARAVVRHDDIRVMRAHLAEVSEADRDRAKADAAGGKAAEQVATARQAYRAAEEGLDLARIELAGQLSGWAGRWIGSGPYPVLIGEESGRLAEVADQLGEPGSPSLAEALVTLTQQRRATMAAAAQRLSGQADLLADRHAQLTGKRTAIEAGLDDAPPATDQRTADRAGRPGAPLWRLVRFADEVPAGVAAAIEGALYGAGLLTAWVHPEPAMTSAALAAAEAERSGRRCGARRPGTTGHRRGPVQLRPARGRQAEGGT